MIMNKKIQNIDRLVEGLQSITKNRCSLSDDDVKILNEVIDVLLTFKTKNSFDDNDYIEVTKVVIELIARVFLNHEFINYMNHLH